jgi:betaine lipid synthase
MGKHLNVPDFFRAVYLVDLSPSLLRIARTRFEKLGWSNVKLVCTDCRDFNLEQHESPDDETSNSSKGADLITMSYSLTMIPEYYPVVDSVASLLSMDGIIGVVDFYAQSQVEFRGRNYAGGFFDRHCTYLNRTFWRAWFDLDRVWLDSGRRDYLEYRFGTKLSVNLRNAMLPGLRIPYYIWIGCSKDATSMDLDVLSFRGQSDLKRSHLPLPSFRYQNHNWRAYYNDQLQTYKQSDPVRISAFSWDDDRETARILSIQSNDVILAPTGCGDNILSFVLQKPKYIYAVDLNPLQNHLLELKAAAFHALDYNDVWKLFGQGRATNFRTLLMGPLSPHMSSHAIQFWLCHGPRIFAGPGLFSSGCSLRAPNSVKRLLFLTGRSAAAKRLVEARTLDEQTNIWDRSIRSVALNRLLCYVVVGRKHWPWSMPKHQRAMIEKDLTSHQDSSDEDNALWEYVLNTLDPVARSTSLSNDNHYYLPCLLGTYSHRCHPDYLQRSSHAELSQPHSLDGLRIYTDEMSRIIDRISPGTLTVAVVLDAMDGLDPENNEADTQIRALSKALAIGGRVLLKSVGLHPWYIHKFELLGFQSQCHGSREPGTCIDR